MLSEAEINHGIYSWKKRYAVHRSFHMGYATQIAHFIGTPLQLFAFVKLFSLIYFSGTIFGNGCNFGLLFVGFLAFIYCRVNLFIGFFAALYLFVCWYISSYVLWNNIWYVNLLIAVGFFGVGLLIQVGIGHRLLQKQNPNLNSEVAEFFQTYDPMIFVLLFFFPFLDLFLPKKDLSLQLKITKSQG